MKKVILLFILCITLNSCFLMPGAAHSHLTKGIDKSNFKIKLRIFCTQNHKEYIVSGTEKNDEVYISSDKMKKMENPCLIRNFFDDSTKLYSLRIGDSNFHRKLLNDTIKVKIVKSNATIEIYKFLILKDNHIKKLKNRYQ